MTTEKIVLTIYDTLRNTPNYDHFSDIDGIPELGLDVDNGRITFSIGNKEYEIIIHQTHEF